MRKRVILLLLAAGIWMGMAAAAENFKGPFRAESLAFYFVHKGGALEIVLEAQAQKTGASPRVLACFYRADESLAGWNFRTLEAGQKSVLRYDYGSNAPKGIYQVRVSGTDLLYRIAAAPETPFGLMALRCRLQTGFPEQFEQSFFFVPENAGKEFKLSHKFGNYMLYSPEGKELFRNRDYNRSSQKFDSEPWKGRVLKLSMKVRKNAPFEFNCTGLPLILCPDEQTAKAIGGSLAESKSGRRFAFRFQAEIDDYIRKLKAEDLEVRLVPPSAMKKEWEKEAHASAALNGLFRHLNAILAEQNVDPGSPEFGRSRNFVALAIAASLNRPFNPYYGNPAVIRRALIGIFNRYLLLKENGTMLDIETNYSGLDCFEAHKMAQAVFFLSPLVSGEERRLLQEGIRRIADRFPFFHVSCENQSSHWLMVYQHLGMAKVPGADYLRLAQEYAASFADLTQTPHMRTGYLQERYGPDATYQGLAACMQSVYFRYTGNPVTKELLRKIYHLFNHSVAPEPDGTVYGTSGFSHRTFGTWVQRQWGAGTVMMAGELPEAAVWHRSDRKNREGLSGGALREPGEDFYRRFPQWLVYPGELHTSLYGGYFFPAEPLENAVFPVEEKKTFVRNFNGEFLALRKKGYYAFVYTGMTSPKWVRSSTCRKPGFRDHRSSWNPIQGMQMVWLKEYGSLFTTTAWNSATYAMTVAELEDGTVSFPDYWTFHHRFDPETGSLSLSNHLFNQPAEVLRSVQFGEEEIVQKVEVRSSGAWSCRGLYEQIPLLEKKNMSMEYLVDGIWRKEPGTVSAIRILNDRGAGFLIALKTPCPVVLAPEQEKNAQKLLPLRFMLGKAFRPGGNLSLEYTIKPIR